MRLGRLILVVATLVTILVFPIVARDALQTFRSPSVYAAAPGVDPAGVVFQNDNDFNNDDDDGDDDDDTDNNDESDNEGEDNENDYTVCYRNLNSNEEVPCDFDDDDGDGSDNGSHDGYRVTRHSNESLNRPTKCFDTREVGVVQLGTGSYDVTVQVMPHSSFNQTTRLTLKSIDPSSAPAISGGTLVDSVVYELKAQSSCDGADINPLPNLVNMGIVYNVPNAVDKAKLQIVRWTGSAWENVDTVPDPVAGNPYVSGSVNSAGTYALIQKP
jgi:hypothetical protein